MAQSNTERVSYDFCFLLPCVLSNASFEIELPLGTSDGQKERKMFKIE